MRTTIDLPEKTLIEARRACGARTKRETVIRGLEEMIRRDKLRRLWDLRGKIPAFNVDLAKSRSR